MFFLLIRFAVIGGRVCRSNLGQPLGPQAGGIESPQLVGKSAGLEQGAKIGLSCISKLRVIVDLCQTLYIID
jgi:hypothetical protein